MPYSQVSDTDKNAFRKILKEALGDGYEVEMNKEVSAQFGHNNEIFDYVVFHNGDAIAAIDYKYNVAAHMLVLNSQKNYIDRFKKVGIKYGIEYFGERHELLVWIKGVDQFELFNFNDLIFAIKGNQICGERFKIDFIHKKIVELADEVITSINKDLVHKIIGLFSEENIEYDEGKASISLKQEAEDDLFRILLLQDDDLGIVKHVCRYSSLNSLFLTMRDGCHAMCSITCMNDKGELSYADKYVSYGAYSISTQTIVENNNCFILSCCKQDMVDNLKMWRLYGNEGRGVCLEYDVDISKIDNKDFFYGPVSYGRGKNDHPKLNFIRNLRHWKKNGWGFELKRWYIWKHFFKSYLFKDEEEVRLLFINIEESKENVEWIMDSTNNIASRICKFLITDNRFPMILTKAIIGPKCHEQGSNVDQFNYMNRQTKTMSESWLKPAIKPSGIEDYR